MKIAAINKPKSNRELLLLCFEDGSAVELSAELVRQRRLAPGVDLTFEELQALRDEHEYLQARKIAVSYLLTRFKPTGKVREYLGRKKFRRPVQERVLDYLREQGLVNDREFGRHFIEDRLARKDAGAFKIKNKLRAFGLPEELIAELMQPLRDDAQQSAAAAGLLRKKFPRPADEEQERLQRRKMYAFLRGKGFAGSAIETAIEQWRAECAAGDA